MEQLIHLRAGKWRAVPTGPGVYWWYFPQDCLEKFRISEICGKTSLNLRRSSDGKVCLYTQDMYRVGKSAGECLADIPWKFYNGQERPEKTA